MSVGSRNKCRALSIYLNALWGTIRALVVRKPNQPERKNCFADYPVF